MPNFQAISQTTHASKRWKPLRSYIFALNDAIVPLVRHELPRAMMHMPIGFFKQSNAYIPVAVLGLQQGQNLFVTHEGRWIGGYTPAEYRGYPFRMADSADGQQVLVIDEDSGLATDTDTDSEPFFDEEGNPAKAIKDVLDFYVQVHNDRLRTQQTCKVLAEHQLFQPWPITVQTEMGERKVDGIYSIDEAAMNLLPSAAYESLRQVGAVQTAYCQLLSMPHIETLGRLAAAHRKAAQVVPYRLGGELDIELLSDGGTISFGPP